MMAKTVGMLVLIGLLLPLLSACSGASDYESEIEGWTAGIFLEGDNSETWLGMMEDPNYPDISMPILYTPKPDNSYGIGSVDHSQASALGAYIYSLRKEKGEPRLDPKFLETHNGVFVIRQFTESAETEPFPQEWISGFEEQVCRISNEVFGGLPVTVIIYQYPEGIHKAMGPRWNALVAARNGIKQTFDDFQLPLTIGGSFYGVGALVDSDGNSLIRDVEGRPISDPVQAVKELITQHGLVGAPGITFRSSSSAAKTIRLTATASKKELAELKNIIDCMLEKARFHG